MMVKETCRSKEKSGPSPLRRRYVLRLVFRCAVLLCCLFLAALSPERFEILKGMNFFSSFSVFHLLWGIWVFDMACQLIPMKKNIPLGSQKLFRQHFRPIREKINVAALKGHIASTTRSAGKVMILWVLLILAVGALYFFGPLDRIGLFLVTVLFYVCDLICVLIWCPFRLILKNRCCTTCRIFNWDHLMMFSPLIFCGGFYAVSLVVLSLFVVLLWEISILVYPERFWEVSNEALQCANCTDKLCTQYCQKLR